LSGSRSMVHMRTDNSAAMLDRESGMVHQAAYLAADAGKLRGNNFFATKHARIVIRRLLIAAAVLFAAAIYPSLSQAQSTGPFAGMAGRWAGGGTVSLDDGSTERIRCRASYAVAGPTLNLSLVCASDAYRFNLEGSIVDQGGAISGNWSESTRNVSGTLQGRGGNGSFEVLASAAGFNSNISLTTRGNRQSITMRADSQFRGATIVLSR
jgi:hypothetical protein